MSQSLRLRSLLAMGVSAGALIAIGSPALAQQTPPPAKAGGTVIEELVVTAQKKEEALQDVPIAVSAFSQDMLQKQKIDGGPNLVTSIPNVNFSKGNFTGYNFQIRGVGAKLVAASGDSGVGVHLNNAPLTSNNLFESDFYDVERVEVLRGPQGTLYGRNATGGVVNVITAKPTDDFGANLRAEYGNYNSIKVRGMINVPIYGDKLDLRVAGTYLKRDGFGKNIATGNDADDRDLYAWRATLKFAPTDSFRATLMYDTFHEDDNRSRIGKQLCTKDPGPANVGGAPYSANPLVAQVERGFFSQGCQATPVNSPGVLGTINSQATLGGLYAALTGLQTGDAFAGQMQDPNIRNIQSSFDPIYRTNTDIVEFNIDWDLTDQLKFTSLTSYTSYDLFTRQDYTRYIPNTPFNTTPNPVNAFAAVPGYAALYGSLFPGGVVNDPQNGASNLFRTSDISSAKSKQWTQELRLQSNFDGPINFNIGGIYLDFKSNPQDYFVMFNTAGAYYSLKNYLTSAATGGAVPYPCPAGNANCIYIDPNQTPTGQGHNYYDNTGAYHLKSRAAFGEVYYQMTPDFKWTIGLRYTDDNKLQQNLAVALGLPGSGSAGPPAGQLPINQVRFRETTGRFGFDWKPHLSFTNDTLIYAFFSRGDKAGGLNPACSLGVGCPPASFAPEFVNAYELGTKNTLMNGSLLLNLTGFYYDYNGYQVSKIVNRTSVNENIDAKIYGVEFETVWSPIRNLRLNANIGYLHTEISNGASVDTFNRTGGNPNLVVMKSSEASNCVVTMTAAQTALGIANATNPFNLLGACTPVSAAGAGTLLAPGAVAVGTNAFGGLVSDGVEMNLKGNELPNSPHWTTSIGGQYTWDLPQGWNMVLRSDFYWQDKSYARIYNTAADRLDSWTNLNATLTIANPGNGWTFELYGKNLTNETVITDTYLTDDSSGLFRNAFYTDPRTYGVAVTKTF